MFVSGSNVRIIILCTLFVVHTPSALAVEIITHTNIKTLSLNERELRAIYSMRKRYWDNGEKIRVFILPDDHLVHKKFVKEYLRLFPHQLRRTWNRMTYTGTGQPPITVDSVAEMMEKISTTPNAIGYTDRRVKNEAIHYFNTP